MKAVFLEGGLPADGEPPLRPVGVTHAKGQPRNPLTADELAVKFRDCAARVLPGERGDALLAMVETLERVPDVRALGALLAAASR